MDSIILTLLMEGIISWRAGVSAAGMFLCCKGFRVPAQSRETMKGPGGISECLPVQTQQTDLQPLVDSSYLVTVTLIMLHSCPPHAAPTLSKAPTLPPSPSSLLPSPLSTPRTVDTACFYSAPSVMVSLQHPSNTADFLISGPFDREAAGPL